MKSVRRAVRAALALTAVVVIAVGVRTGSGEKAQLVVLNIGWESQDCALDQSRSCQATIHLVNPAAAPSLPLTLVLVPGSSTQSTSSPTMMVHVDGPDRLAVDSLPAHGTLALNVHIGSDRLAVAGADRVQVDMRLLHGQQTLTQSTVLVFHREAL